MATRRMSSRPEDGPSSRRGVPSAKSYRCPVELTLDLVGGRWKAHILWELRGGPRRFNDLLRALGGVSHKVLAQCLRDLERTGLVARRVRSGHQTEYAATPFGETLRPSLDALARWAKRHHAAVGATLDWPT